MRWAFWRTRSAAPHRPLPDDVGLPTAPRPSAAPPEREQEDDGDRRPSEPAARTSGGAPTTDASPLHAVPLPAPQPPVDRSAVAASGDDVADAVRTRRVAPATDHATLAVAATGVLAARLPALSGVDGAVVFDEPADELLHAYADVLATRAQSRGDAGREDLLAVAHLAAAAATLDGAGDPALLLLADAPPGRQARAAVQLLAQTAEDGGGGPERLAAEVRALFGRRGR